MFKRPLLLLIYTLAIIVISSLITTAYFHYFVLNQGIEQQALVAVSDNEIKIARSKRVIPSSRYSLTAATTVP